MSSDRGCGGLCGNATINYTQAATCRPIVDQHISPPVTLEYWDAMHRTMGNVDGFGRLYLFPGMAHCAGGVGPNLTRQQVIGAFDG